MTNNINSMTQSGLRGENDILKGLLLLILAVGGNFTGETLSCKVQKLFSENIIAKQLLTFFLLYFSISIFTNKLNPLLNLFYAFLTFIFFILINKGHLTLIVINYIIIIIIFFIHISIDFYENKKSENNKVSSFLKKNNKKIKILLSVAYFILLFLVLFNFIIYFIEKKKEYTKDWNILIFIFGKTVCKSISK